MNTKSMIAVRVDRNGEMLIGGFVALAAMAMFFLAPAAARAADPGASGPVKLESVPGSSIPRVILTAKAAERLGIQTAKVSEESVVRMLMVSGLIIPPMDKQPESKPGGGGFGGYGRSPATAPQPAGGGFGGYGRVKTEPAPQPVSPPAAPQVTLPAFGEVWVLVTLSPAELERLATDKPVRLLPLATRDSSEKGLLGKPSGMPPVEDVKRSMLSLYYVVPGKDHGLAVNNRVRVELPLSGSDEKQKAVPYSAVYYDAKGKAWVYINGTPLTYERQRIVVERVVGDVALLSEGPAVGKSVVSVGSALLYGCEIFKK